MSQRYPVQVKDRAIKMVLSHLEEYESVYQAAFAIGPKVGVRGESLRRWVQKALDDATPAGQDRLAESARVKQLERENRDLREANEILRAASIFFAGELDPRQSRR